MERLFDTANLRSLLATPQAWRLVCGALPAEADEARDPAYARWARRHRDRHAYREVLFCVDGETLEHFNGRDYLCRPGTVFLFDAGDAHAQGYPLDGRSFAHIWLRLLANDIIVHTFTQRGDLTTEMRGTPLVLARGDLNQLQRYWQMAAAPPPWLDAPLRRAALLSALHMTMVRVLANWLAPSAHAAGPRRHAVVAALQRHIETHLAADCDLDSLARVAGYSKFHFCRIFKECAGETVLAFIDRCRINRASEMAAAGARQKEIAAALGFASPTAFANWRRKICP